MPDVRSQGINLDHVWSLAKVDADLPPIVLDRTQRRVIDGAHRVEAAKINGRTVIEAVVFDGSADDAFMLAVQANSAHGLPLAMEDRRAAVERIVRSRPELSDRTVATAAGLSAKVVGDIRRSSADIPQSNVRIGQDGRARPLDPSAGRMAAVDVLARQPEASLRVIAKEAGVSVSTARDVRERLRAGKNPLPPSQRGRDELSSRRTANHEGGFSRGHSSGKTDARSTLDMLRQDPGLRYTESGRDLLRWLARRVLGPMEWRDLAGEIAPHSAVLLTRLAYECADTWAQFAEELEAGKQDSA